MDSSDEAHVRAAPEVQHLIRLRKRGWGFWPPRVNDMGEPIEQVAVYAWPELTADKVSFRTATDAAGWRITPLGELLWHLEGTLEDVVSRILALPGPTERGAPCLAIGRANWPLAGIALNALGDLRMKAEAGER